MTGNQSTVTHGFDVGCMPALPDQNRIDRLFNRVSWRIVPFLCLSVFVAYIDRVNVSFAKLQMNGELHLSEAAYGLGAGLFFLGYILFEIPSNLALQKTGARVWLARIMITWGLATALMWFVSGATSFCILRFVLGVAEAGFVPGALFYLGQWLPARKRGRVIALFMVGMPLSSVIASPLSGAILAYMSGFAGVSGWRWLFFIEAVPPVLLGVWALAFLPDHNRAVPWLSEEERHIIKAEIEKEQNKIDKNDHSLLSVFTDKNIWLIGFIDGAILLLLYTVAFWFPSMLHARGITNPMTIGFITVLPHLCAVVSMLVNGWHSDRSGERIWHVAIPAILAAVFLSLATIPSLSLSLLVACVVVANACVLAALPPFWCIPTQYLEGGKAAPGLALATSIANTAGFFSTSAVGFALQLTGSIGGVMLTFAGIMMIAVCGVFFLPEGSKKILKT